MNKNEVYIVVGYKSWNERIFNEIISKYAGTWHFIKELDELNFDTIKSIGPKYIFFLHWSWKVPEEIINNYECICFHMTDLPYGRGGSPLQNLIIRGHTKTKLTAFRMTEEFDAGPVYLKKDLSLQGNAEQILIRASYISAEMIKEIICNKIIAKEQKGNPTIFKRRKPAESEIPPLDNLESLFDFIRMLDANGYPRAFINSNGFKYEISRANIYDDRVKADVVITKIKDKVE